MASRRDTPLERLRGSVIRYEAPLEPAADEEDWVRLGKEDSEVRDTLRVYCQAVKVFGDHTVACEWLKTPIPALSGKAPAERLDTSEGRAIVRDILAKIEQGEFT
ncbi:MbcA/ParS/Xre antitoxin family protein [Chromohalobacter canadensis]|uniref:MbcA/ParS/Xre antitoxin family protein n=1 Tax=Chromohalobacter canadensis TaxID=141389 RepID=A0ABZ0Y8W6_9GAMM|nr:MbcA/ParS/Xre antitoxin family protein [Chromohalobacter canadensis]MCK0770313.1 MbcA/ParS/Xre antitoxin family protein [Chromohalobacter canadensis]WQH07777.1 MbcA/ParS/Xre antitoxin family protein [Chromohalobacter canadensis]